MAEATLRRKALKCASKLRAMVRKRGSGMDAGIRIKTSHSCEREWILEGSPRTRLVCFVVGASFNLRSPSNTSK